MQVRKDKCAPRAHRQPGRVGRSCTPPRSPVSVEDGFHLGDVGLEGDGTELVQLLVVEQQVLVPETNGLERVRDRTGDARSALDYFRPISYGDGG